MRAGLIKARARELGFDLCGIARAHPLDPGPLDRWLGNGWDADLGYIKARRDERLNPDRVLPGARSVIALAASYGPQPGEGEPDALALTGEALPERELIVARYARGRDYHNVILKPARKLAAWIRTGFNARVYCEVDTGAVMEKPWAQEAGLGWIGKNGCLIHERLGSWLLLGALVTDLELDADAPHPDRCGDCIACIPACPTNAIPEPRFVDATRCLAYHTIEHRGPIPLDLAARGPGRVFGCDICQDVCPWNRRARPGTLVQLRARPGQEALNLSDVLALTPESARARFEGTPLARAGRDGLVRSALAVTSRPLSPRELAQVRGLAEDAAPGVRAEATRLLQRQGPAPQRAQVHGAEILRAGAQREGSVSTAPVNAPDAGEQS